MATPFISPIKNQGGTFYQFQSAIEDFNFTNSSSNKEFRFSRFALLDLPNQKDGATGINTSLVSNQPTTFLKSEGVDLNFDFAESFQNYCLNFESMLLSQPTYDEAVNLTVSERVFWRWIKELGAIRFREANIGNPEVGGERTRRTEDNITIDNLSIRKEIGKRFVEEDTKITGSDTTYPYSKVVKYIGGIDAVSSVKYQGSGFTELYIYVPVECGFTPKVLFKSILNDTNYSPGMTLRYQPAKTIDSETIVGRSYNDIHPLGLDIRAHFDSDTDSLIAGNTGVNSYSLSIKKDGETSYDEGWWFTPNRNTYFTPTELNDWRNDWCKLEGYKDSIATEREFLRSRLDGIAIDFELGTSYSDNLSGSFKSFEDYNKSELSSDFEFNTILVYYDLIDKTDPTKTVSNLYGVYFVDRWKDTLTDGYEIERYKKFKPNSITRQNGNSFGFKINLKLDLNAQDSIQVTSVNEYNNFSMHLFIDAMKRVRQTHDLLIDNIANLKLLQDKIDVLEDRIAEEETLSDISNRLDTLEQSIITSQYLLSNSKDVLGLIDRNYKEITNIYQNLTSVEMSYNLDVINPGAGIQLDKSLKGKVKVSAINDGYSLSETPIIDYTNIKYDQKNNWVYHTHTLQNYNNYLKIINNPLIPNQSLILDRSQSFRLFIDDSIGWKKGQVIRISFGDKYIFENMQTALTIVTDYRNLLKNPTPYSAVCGVLSTLDFNSFSNKPKIDIVCIDPNKFIFSLDIL